MIVRTCPDCGALAGDNWKCDLHLCFEGDAPAPDDVGTERTTWNLVRVLPVAVVLETIRAEMTTTTAPTVGYRSGVLAAIHAIENKAGDDAAQDLEGT